MTRAPVPFCTFLLFKNVTPLDVYVPFQQESTPGGTFTIFRPQLLHHPHLMHTGLLSSVLVKYPRLISSGRGRTSGIGRLLPSLFAYLLPRADFDERGPRR